MKLDTHQEMQEVYRRTEICYLCGDSLNDGRPTNRDHIPPKKIFLQEHRQVPFLLPTHRECNTEWSISDEQAKIILQAIHDPLKQLPPKTQWAGTLLENGKPVAAVLSGFNLHAVCIRIVRASHLALYGQTLPKGRDFASRILTPLPRLDLTTHRPSMDNFEEYYPRWGGHLRQQLQTGSIDYIHAYSGNFRFASIWETINGSPAVLFSIDIYGWHRLGDQAVGRKQSCIGAYPVSQQMPVGASVVASTHPKGVDESYVPWE